MGFWFGKQIVIGIGGGIAAYKTLELIRLLKKEGAEVIPVPTPAGLRFVTELTLQSLAGGPVHGELMQPLHPGQMDHIRLAREADLVIIAPTTADLMARMAVGQADDLLTALLLARQGPTLAAPAMNPAMWSHPATQRNLARLQEDGMQFIGPATGPMACGETGAGRMVEPATILEAAQRLLTPKILTGRRILITAGPTREELDPVRFISNHSSGKMGWETALSALRAGALVDLVHGPVALPPPPGASMWPVVSAQEMFKTVIDIWIGAAGGPVCDAAILTAAVADFRPEMRASEKIKKKGSEEPLTLHLTQNIDILAVLSAWSGVSLPNGQQRAVIGFAAETGEALARGREKLARKHCDLLAINDVTAPGCGFGSDTNAITLIGRNGQEDAWPLLPKTQVAERLIRAVADLLK
ncbi:MAG: bifunctional phosphopantothenoylcysteine decarboxylase/phosphopantothenate--cysteine ligase CoaBC [Magnetococcus sp. YQC-5]